VAAFAIAKNSEYFYHPAGHVLTGDLGIPNIEHFENIFLKDHSLESKIIFIGKLKKILLKQ